MIRSLMKLCVLVVISSTALAQQPQLTGKFDMPWGMTSIAQVDALRGPSTTGVWSAIPLQTAKIDLNVGVGTIAASPTGVTQTIALPGQPTAWTIMALRITVCANGSMFVCEQPMKLRWATPTPYKVRAGHPVIVGITLMPGSFGNIAIQEDALTTAGTITPPPVVTPPPPPPPAPSGFVTADGTWTLESPDPNCEGGIKTVVRLNGVSKGAADEIRVCIGTLFARDGTTWYQGSAASTCGGSGWTRQTPPC